MEDLPELFESFGTKQEVQIIEANSRRGNTQVGRKGSGCIQRRFSNNDAKSACNVCGSTGLMRW